MKNSHIIEIPNSSAGNTLLSLQLSVLCTYGIPNLQSLCPQIKCSSTIKAISRNSAGGVSLTFRELSKIFSRNFYLIKIAFLWEFQAETVHVCPNPRFGHTYKVSALNSRYVISGIVYFREIILESSRNVSETTPWFPSYICSQLGFLLHNSMMFIARWRHQMEIISTLLALCEGNPRGGDRWILFTKTSDAELWYFLWSTPEQTVKQTIETPVIWDAIAPIMTSLQWVNYESIGTDAMATSNQSAINLCIYSKLIWIRLYHSRRW